MVVHVNNPIAREVEASRVGLQEHPQLQGESEASQRFLSPSNTNKQKTNKQTKKTSKMNQRKKVPLSSTWLLSYLVQYPVRSLQQEKGGRKKDLLERDGKHTHA